MLPPAASGERVLPKAWRWIPGSSAEVPFAEHSPREHKRQDRLYQPDAVLRMPPFSRRYVIEYETGTASLTNAKHRASTITKLGRFYRAFIEPRLDVHELPKKGPAPTYASRFFGEDDLYAKLVFVTRTAARRDSIGEVTDKGLVTLDNTRPSVARELGISEITGECTLQVKRYRLASQRREVC